jgi:hypothetical protein
LGLLPYDVGPIFREKLSGFYLTRRPLAMTAFERGGVLPAREASQNHRIRSSEFVPWTPQVKLVRHLNCPIRDQSGPFAEGLGGMGRFLRKLVVSSLPLRGASPLIRRVFALPIDCRER